MIRRTLIQCTRCASQFVRSSKIRAAPRALFFDTVPSLSSTTPIQHSFHSSHSTRETVYESPNVILSKQFTERLLEEIPLGKMNESDWNEAYPTFLWWTQQGTPEAVETAWKLLDRLVQEQHHVGYAQVALESHWLNRIVEMSRIVTTESENGTHQLVVPPEEWLQRLETYAPYLTPNAATYTMIMGALTKWSEEPVPELVESLLHQMYEDSADYESLEPDIRAYNSVLYAWANSGLEEAPHRAEALFEKMATRGVEPDAVSYGTLVTTWSRSRDPNAASRAQEILREMEQHENVPPNTIVYNAVLQAWERSAQEDSVHHADVLFREMLNLAEHGNELVTPDGLTFRIIIRTLVYGGQAARADDVIRLQQKLYDDGDLDVAPSRKHFDAILHQWANSLSPNAAKRAESLLRMMNDLYQQGNEKMKPNYKNFSAVIAAWTKSKNYNAARHAQAMLDWMQEFQVEDDDKMVPNTLMCTSIINSWWKSRDESAPEQAEALLNKMMEWYEAGNESVRPNVISFNALMKVWAKSRRIDAPERVEAIMRRMSDYSIHPNRVSYNQLINTYANSNDPAAPERAEFILRHLLQRGASGDIDMKPDLISFTTVMKAWANSTVDGAAERAEAFLRYMEEVFTETGDEAIKPNDVCYAMAIRAWINSGDENASIRAAALLEEVHDLYRAGHHDFKLKKQLYFEIMQLLAKSRGSVTVGQVAERILLHMQYLAEEGDTHMSPSTKYFNLTIRAWGISGHRLAEQRGEKILNLMHGAARDDLKPNRLTYNFVIRAWSRSGDVFAGKRAERHLERMLELSAAGNDEFTPDSYTYRDLAIAWKYSGHADAEIKANKYAKLSRELRAKAEAK